MTTEDLAPGGVQPEITASTAAPEPEKVDDLADGAKAAEATTEDGKQPDAATEDAEAKAASEAGKALNERKQSARERVEQAVARQREAERSAKSAWDRVAQLEGKVKAPNAEEYNDPSKLNADQINYSLDQRRIQDLKDQHAEATQEAERARAVAWMERVEDFRADHPDFDQVGLTAPIGRETSLMVADMEDGPAVAYHLGKNPAEARRIEGLPERQRPFALGKIAAQITAPPPRRITTAPAPVETASGKSGGGQALDASKVDNMDEYARLRKSGWRG